MTPHTPGPWEATTGIGSLSHYVVHRERKNGRHESYMVCAVGDTPVAEANARLIAAAPDLAKMVAHMMAYCPVGTQDKARSLLTTIGWEETYEGVPTMDRAEGKA